MRVLFVCSGNICRSPMAAEYFRHRAAQRGLKDVEVESAGTLGIEGAPASSEAVRAMAEIGVDLEAHRSRGIDAETVRAADVVIVMTRRHRAELDDAFPGPPAERWLLRAFERGPQPDPGARDLADPIGKPLPSYRRLRAVLTRSLDHLIDYLAERHGR